MRVLVIALCLVVTGCASTTPRDTYYSEMNAATSADSLNSTTLSSADCYLMGKDSAKEWVNTGWDTANGFAGGLLFGVIGAAISYAFVDEPSPPSDLTSDLKEKGCRAAFRIGYGEAGQSKKRSATLTGGIIGTATLIAIYVSTYSGSY
jgi:hypothetical protein